jgi:hypothetical protein
MLHNKNGGLLCHIQSLKTELTSATGAESRLSGNWARDIFIGPSICIDKLPVRGN